MDTARSREARVDWAWALGLLCLGLLSTFVARDLGLGDGEGRVPGWAQYALALPLYLPVAWRRRWPLTVAVIVGVLFMVYRVVEVPDSTASTVALFLTLFSAGERSRHPARDWVRGAVVAASMALVAWAVYHDADFVGFDQLMLSSYVLVMNAAFFTAAWLLGDAWRGRRRDQAELARRAEQLAAEREERARRAVLDERVRIARDLHDVVAHHVSVMGVQAAGARRMLDRDRQRTAEALGAVEESGRQAVGELQRLVGVLRDGDERDGAHPQPTLDDIDRLVAAAGLPARLQWIGRARPVASSVALSAYRIVQESLTNVHKHAGVVATTVVMTFTPTALQVEVHNERGDATADVRAFGRGLLGMRERATLLGGRFEHGVADDGGYRILAQLPTSDAYGREPSPA